MKKLITIVLGIFVVLVLLAVALLFWLDSAVLKGVNSAGPVALGVPVSLEDANIRLLQGKIALTGFHIGNPKGFKTDGLLDLGSIFINVDLGSLKSDTIVIKRIAIDGLVLTYEKGLLDSNLGALIESLSADEKEAEGKPPEEQKPGHGKAGKKVVIEKLTLTHSKMNFSITGAAALTGGGVIPLPLPDITVTDLGKEKEGGLTFVQAIRRILTEIAGASGTAIAGSGKLLGEGAMAIGEGTVDAGKAVVDGTVDAGKAVVGGAEDAGKAVVDGVGNALKAVNPFKK